MADDWETSIRAIAADLGLAFHPGMQDWGIEAAVPERAAEFANYGVGLLDRLHTAARDDLVDLVLQSVEEALTEPQLPLDRDAFQRFCDAADEHAPEQMRYWRSLGPDWNVSGWLTR